MNKVKVVTRTRGFWVDLFQYRFGDIKFLYNHNDLYEVPKKARLILHNIINYKILDFFGVFIRVKAIDTNAEMHFSYNRFLKSDKPYLIALENPTALVHYSDTRMKTIFSKFRLKKCFNDKNLKGIVCLSKACYETMNDYYDIPSKLNVTQIYPYVEDNYEVNTDFIYRKSHKKNLECLYVSSNFELKGGDDILEVFKNLRNDGNTNINLTIITKINNLSNIQKKLISDNGIALLDFNFSKKELYQYYRNTNILLNPTRMDSFSLVTLEAMKNGCAIIGTDIYAIKEMVTNGFNGYLTSPRFRYWNDKNLVDHNIKKHAKTTFESSYIDENIVGFLYNKILYLESNRNILGEMSIKSYIKSTTGEFCNHTIINKWEMLLKP